MSKSTHFQRKGSTKKLETELCHTPFLQGLQGNSIERRFGKACMVPEKMVAECIQLSRGALQGSARVQAPSASCTSCSSTLTRVGSDCLALVPSSKRVALLSAFSNGADLRQHLEEQR